MKHSYLLVAKSLQNIQFSEQTKKLLLEAGSPLKPEEFLALRIITAAGLGLLSALFGFQWYLSVLAVVIKLAAPVYFFKRKRKNG